MIAPSHQEEVEVEEEVDLSTWGVRKSYDWLLCIGNVSVDDYDNKLSFGEEKLLLRSFSAQPTSQELHLVRRSSTASTFIPNRENDSPRCRSQSSDATLCEKTDPLPLKRRSRSTCSTFTVNSQDLSYSHTASLSPVSRKDVGAGYVAGSVLCDTELLQEKAAVDLSEIEKDQPAVSAGQQASTTKDADTTSRRSENMSTSVFFSAPLKAGAGNRTDDTVSLCWRGMKQLFRQMSGSRTRQHPDDALQQSAKPTKPPAVGNADQNLESIHHENVEALGLNKNGGDVVHTESKSTHATNGASSFNGDFDWCIPANYSFCDIDDESPALQRVSIATVDDAIWRVARSIYEHVCRGSRMPVSSESEIFREELYAMPSRKNIRMRCKTFRQYPSPSTAFITEVAETFRAEVCTFSKVFKFMRHFVFKSGLSCEVLVIGLIYVERIIHGSSVVLTSNNWRPIVMSSLLVASKVHDDFSSWNVELTVIFPEYTLSSVNKLERILCRALNYSLIVDWQQFALYYAHLQRFGNPPWIQRKRSDANLPITGNHNEC
eukprot:Lankesteria_metandrocarpae@DN4907_c0_g1_i4.p1